MIFTTRLRPDSAALSRILLKGIAIAALAFAVCWPCSLNAAGIIYQFDNEFSSGTPPSGPAPWMTATIQTISPGTVQLTVDNSGLLGTEFVSGFYLNLNTNFNPLDLSISYVSSVGDFAVPTTASGAIQLGTDSFKADGDGKYDLLFNFSTAGGSTFGAGDSITYQISGIPGLVANDFVYLSAPNGGHGPFYAAAHVQGIGADGSLSGWVEPSLGAQPIVVPEPSSCALLALSLGFLGLRRRVNNRNSH